MSVGYITEKINRVIDGSREKPNTEEIEAYLKKMNMSVDEIADLPDVPYQKLNLNNIPYEYYLFTDDKNGLNTTDEYEKWKNNYCWFVYKNKSYINIEIIRPTGGYGLALKHIKKIHDTIIMVVDETSSEQGQFVTQAFTTPGVEVIIDEIPEKILVIDTNSTVFYEKRKKMVTQQDVEEGLKNKMYQDLVTKEGVVCLPNYGKYGFVDLNGRKVLDFQYDSAEDFENGLAKVKLKEKYGFINKKGEFVIGCKYDEVDTFINGLACVKYGGKYGMIDQKGKAVIDFKYDEKIYFYDYDYAKVVCNGKHGIINKKGKVIIECKYDIPLDEIGHNGIIQAMLDGKYGLINSSGDVILDFKYDSISCRFDSHNNVETFFVALNGLFGIVNQEGKIVLEPIYDDIRGIDYDSWKDRLQILKYSTGCSGIVDLNGNIIVPAEYSNDITFNTDGTGIFIKNDYKTLKDVKYIIDRNGKVLKR